MKNLAAPGLAALLSALFTALALTLLRPERAGSEPRASAPAPAVASPAAPGQDELARRVDELAMRLAGLEARLSEASAASTEREAVLAAVPEILSGAQDPSAALAPGAARSDAPLQDVIVEVIERHQAEQEAAAEVRRRQEREARALTRSERIAQELGLPTADRNTLCGVLIEESERRSAAFASLEDSGYDPFARDTIRTAMEEIDAWRKQELTSRLGASTAERVLELEDSERSFYRRRGGDGDRGQGGRRGG